MRILFCLLFILSMSSCILHYDKLTFYKKDYKPNCESVRYDGYYRGKIVDIIGDTAYQVAFFYNDGSCYVSPLFYDTTLIEKEFTSYPNSSKDDWGFFKCVQDTLHIEYIHREVLDWKAIRVYLWGVISREKIEFKNPGFNYEFNFISFNTKPDSTLNWLKTHRKYRIK